MKTKFYLAGLLALPFNQLSTAQNASQWNDASNISGSNSAAFGYNATGFFGGFANAALGYYTMFNTYGVYNTAMGAEAMYNSTGGSHNTAAGFRAMYGNYDGNYNVAVGDSALYNNDTDGNTAVGASALYNNTYGVGNVAVGLMALHSNVSGSNNTAMGLGSLYANTGSNNTAFGYQSLFQGTGGSGNVAIGSEVLYYNAGNNNVGIGSGGVLLSNTTGYENVAIGLTALFSNTTGIENVAIGANSMVENTTGQQNIAMGYQSLVSNTTGQRNSGLGTFALGANTTGTNNTGVGFQALNSNTSGFANTTVGSQSDVSGGAYSNSSAFGNQAVTNATNKIRLGNTAITVIEGQVAPSNPSDGRFKTNVREQDVKGLEFILKLRPVVYNFDTKKFTEFLTKNMEPEHRKDYLKDDFKASTAIRHSGFIAQEVEKTVQETGYDFDGLHKPADDNDNYSIAYSQFVVPLVKGMQEQQKMLEEQNKTIESLQKEVALQKDMISRLAANGSRPITDGVDEPAAGGIKGFSMEQNQPNPFTSETVVNYQLPQGINTAYLGVYDLSGKQISTFPLSQKGQGSVSISADKLQAGIYLYSIVADGKVLGTRRMVVSGK